MAQTTLHLLARTEHSNIETKFWSVLIRRHPSEHDHLDVEQHRGLALMIRYQQFKAAVRRWIRIEPAIDVAGSAQPNLSPQDRFSKRPRNA
jgi:hypothetical protein